MDRCKLFPYGPLHVVSLWTVVSRFFMYCCTPFTCISCFLVDVVSRFLMDSCKFFPIWTIFNVVFLRTVASRLCRFLMNCCKLFLYGPFLTCVVVCFLFCYGL